ncbi:aldehyde dehydrogenase family protein [Amycolatopsis rhabdoformis]|uniref:Aldehyde dehydrogenase family protein n=1 Tax=Amycolatopsis rhabdoformis TaxID=1448059 RepID=A0ABZ1IMP9_9PSEU|nr:aldehyde dehydrogenase family protein [Amycolatopsis rhabdoformis]WSE34705.1 aldehyde dehydrogenase family protein [Amycolatopsis rhabdoformis]
MPETHRHFIGGQWRPASDGSTFDVLNPFDGKVYAHAAAGTKADAAEAVTAAEEAFPAWAALAPREKQKMFLRAADIIDRRHDELAAILAEETGSSIYFAQFQQNVVTSVLRQAANWVFDTKGEVLQGEHPGTFSMGVRKPLGVVAAFTPWNGANVLVWRSVAQTIAAGNTIVVKPSEEAPISAGLVVAQVAEEAGFPPGVINVVTHAPGAAGPIADEFFERPEVRCLYFIGSVRTGRMLAERAGRTLKRSVMELGGYNPLVILADTDLDYAVRVATYSAFFHQGQICMCARKVLVERPLYEQFVQQLAERAKALPQGDPRDAATVIGPLINDHAVTVMQDRIDDAVAKGAKIVTGGRHHGRIFEPTILVDVPDDAIASYEETFGPLLVIQPVDSADEAVEVVNRSLYGLTASVLSADTYRGFEIANRLKSGMVHVNGPTVADEITAPIGGVRDSGWGRHGTHAREDLTDLVWIEVRNDEVDLPV